MGEGAREASAQVAETRTTWRHRWRHGLRWRLIPLLFFGLAIAYVDRANLGVAAPHIQEDLGISAAVMGVVMSIFPLALAITQLPAGVLIDRIGPRIMYFVAVVWWSLVTMATALVNNVALLFTSRALLGVGESPAHGSTLKATSEWFPRRERALASSFYDLGSEFGSAISIPLVTVLIAATGWRGSFVLCGLLGLLWAIWWIRSYRSPAQHPKLSERELAYIRQGGARIAPERGPGRRDSGAPGTGEQRSEEGAEAIGVAWYNLLRYRTVWGIIIGFVCRVFVMYFFITWFPSYLANERGFTLLEIGFLGAIPGLVAIGGDLAGGFFSDWLIRRGRSTTSARKIPLVAGMLVGSAVGFAGFVSSGGMALALLTLSYTGVAFCTGALWSLPADVAPGPGNVATIGALMNTAANIARAVSATLVGALAGLTGSFTVPLIAMGGFTVLGALAFGLLVGEVKPLPLKGKVVRA